MHLAHTHAMPSFPPLAPQTDGHTHGRSVLCHPLHRDAAPRRSLRPIRLAGAGKVTGVLPWTRYGDCRLMDPDLRLPARPPGRGKGIALPRLTGMCRWAAAGQPRPSVALAVLQERRRREGYTGTQRDSRWACRIEQAPPPTLPWWHPHHPREISTAETPPYPVHPNPDTRGGLHRFHPCHQGHLTWPMCVATHVWMGRSRVM